MPFPLDPRFVAETEKRLGVRFPLAFVAAMLKENGGYANTPPDGWWLYPFRDGSDRKRIKRTCNDIVHQTHWARGHAGFPQDAVAIGSNGGGDELVLLPRISDPTRLQNAVYWWDHETGTCHKVADDFGDLVITERHSKNWSYPALVDRLALSDTADERHLLSKLTGET